MAVDVGVDGGREGLKSFDPSTLPANPSPDLFYRHHVSLPSAIGKVWARREVIFALAERDVRAGYQQPALGMAWALLSPVPQVVRFIQIFLPGEGVPRRPRRHVSYAIYAYVGILCWTFFNPGASGIDGVRNTMLLGQQPDWTLLGIGGSGP